jgi:hypothetical protein
MIAMKYNTSARRIPTNVGNCRWVHGYVQVSPISRDYDIMQHSATYYLLGLTFRSNTQLQNVI